MSVRASREWTLALPTQAYPCNSARKEKDVETLHHILGIVYYTVALFLVIYRNHKNKQD